MPLTKTELRRLDKVRRQLTEKAAELIVALDAEAIVQAPLNQRAAALGVVVDRLLKLHSLSQSLEAAAQLEGETSEKVIRIEYQYPDGSLHAAPPWADADPGHGGALQSGGLWSAFRQDDPGPDSAA